MSRRLFRPQSPRFSPVEGDDESWQHVRDSNGRIFFLRIGRREVAYGEPTAQAVLPHPAAQPHRRRSLYEREHHTDSWRSSRDVPLAELYSLRAAGGLGGIEMPLGPPPGAPAAAAAASASASSSPSRGLDSSNTSGHEDDEARPSHRAPWWRRLGRRDRSSSSNASQNGEHRSLARTAWSGIRSIFRRRRGHHAEVVPIEGAGPSPSSSPQGATSSRSPAAAAARPSPPSRRSSSSGGVDVLLSMFMETLAFAILDQQEMEATEAEIARLERSIELDRYEAVLESLEQEFLSVCRGRLNYRPDPAILASYPDNAAISEDIIVSHLHQHPLKFQKTEELEDGAPSCSMLGATLGCARDSEGEEQGLFVCSMGCPFALCVTCSRLQPHEARSPIVRKCSFHEHKLLEVDPAPGFVCLCQALDNGCEGETPSSAFICANGCQFTICKKCLRLPLDPEEFKLSSLHCHPLAKSRSPNQWLCDARFHRQGCGHRDPLGPRSGVSRFRCSTGCDFDLCEDCIRISPATREEVRLSYLHPHPLTLSHHETPWVCRAWAHPRGCERSSYETHCNVRRYRCDWGCDFELCEDCAELEPPSLEEDTQEELNIKKDDLARRLVITRLTCSIARQGDRLILARQGHAPPGIIQDLERQLKLHLELLATAETKQSALEAMMQQEQLMARVRGEEDETHIFDTKLSSTVSSKTDYKIASQRLRLSHLRRRSPGKLTIEVHRDQLLRDSSRFLETSDTTQLRRRLYVKFLGEEGKDAGGVAREWFFLLSHQLTDPLDGLFEYSAADLSTLQIKPNANPSAADLQHFRNVGTLMGLALFNGCLLDVFFVRPFYKMMLGRRITLKDLESVDAQYYKSLVYLLENDAEDLDLTFSIDQPSPDLPPIELKPGGADMPVTDDNKAEFVRLVLDWRLASGVRAQMDAILQGFFNVISRQDIQRFSPSELELALCGLAKIDIDDWQANTSYVNGYDESSDPVRFFWEVLRSWDTVMQTKVLQFVTGTSRVPAAGFGALQGTSGPCAFSIYRSGDSGVLPVGHTCINRLDLPPYRTQEECAAKLRMAVEETDGFGLE